MLFRSVSDRVRVIACLTNLPNIVHSDNPAETLAASEWQKLKKHVGATEKDTLVLVWGNEEDAEMGASEIIIRAKEATMGVPSETRQALQDGTTGFERILPGPERMYPDTDLPPKKITEERKDRIREQLPERFWLREARYRRLGVPEDLIKYLAISEYAPLFDKLTSEKEVDPVLAATALIQYPKRLKKKRLPIGILNEEIFEKIFEAYKAGKLPKDGILHLMEKTLVNGYFSEGLIPDQADEKTIENEVQIAVRQFEEAKFNNPDSKDKYIMGQVMDKLRIKADGSEVRVILEKKLSEVK